MKHIPLYNEFKPGIINEGSSVATINDISDTFTVFYNQLNDLSAKGAFSDKNVKGHLQTAIESLDEAWEELCDEHGVEYEKTEVNL
jgi:uncharacterized 2Fe-2S/4Fe-4S cluster protein (DUF4445 family)